MDERELLLLGLLLRQEMHGYQLNHFLEHRLDSLLALNRSTAYFLLVRLANRGLVDVALQREGRRPERRVYRLTKEGRDAFQAALRKHLASYSPERYPDEVGLLFLEILPREEQLLLLRDKLKVVQGRRGWAEERREAHAETPARWMLDHRVTHLEAEERWLLGVITQLEMAERMSIEGGDTEGSLILAADAV